MVVGTRRSSRRKAGEPESDGDQSDVSSQSLPSPRKRVSRARKTNKSEEKIPPIPEETLNLDKIVAPPPPPAEIKDKQSVKDDHHGSVIPQSMDKTSVSNESLKSADCSSESHDTGRSKEVTVERSKEESLENATSHCDVIKNVREAYKQESKAQKRSKGMPKSGRPWKTEQTARFSDMRKDKPLRSSWQLKMAMKAEKLSVRKYQQELEDAKRQAILLKKQRRAEHMKQKEENQKKSEVVQVIKNPAKLKRMKKKQLRKIEKRP